MQGRKIVERLNGQRERIKFRLEMARAVERSWPSTRAFDNICRLENELKSVDDILFGVEMAESDRAKMSCT